MGKTETGKTETAKTEVEVSVKTIDEAIVLGCAELGVGMDEVDFEITDQGGVFRKMKVKISLKNKPEEEKKEEVSDPVSEKVAGIKETAGGEENPENTVKTANPENSENTAKTAIFEKSVKTEKKSKKTGKTAKAADGISEDPVNAADEEEKNKTHEIVKGTADEFVIEGKERQPRIRKEREERPVVEFDPNAKKFVKTLEFATDLFKLLDDTLTITTSHNDREFIIEVHGENVARLIGKEGHTMSAINVLVSSVAINNSTGGEGRRVVVDIENYREKRNQSLVELAKRKAEWVIQSGRTVKLEPMPARERVIIHTALQDMEGIATHSTGDEPNRYLIISPSSR
jgi:spoIIIJ-associated protein